MNKTTNDNAVRFLLDGDVFFKQLGILLDELLDSDSEGRYLRMAYWQFSPDTIIPANDDDRPTVRLIDMLASLAKAGVKVRLIAWAGTRLVNNLTEEMKSSWRMNSWVNKFNDSNPDTPIGMYLESYGKSTNIGTSTHQKITIINTGESRTCLVGGENLAEKYLSSDDHNPLNWWHDTAIQVSGPITQYIDAEFVRRWNKKSTHNLEAPEALPNEDDAGDTTITMLTTNIEATPPEQDIRRRVLQRIGESNENDSIYMENYALTDPAIVNALTQKVETYPEFDLVVVVNHPQNNMMPSFEGFSYLMFYTYASLQLPVMESVSVWESYLNYTLSRTTIYEEGSVQNLRVETPSISPSTSLATFNPATQYKFSFDVGTIHHRYNFSYIAGISENKPFMYSPVLSQPSAPNSWPYPHSKLAIFKNRYTMIGTSNWTYRSMQYDGEITLEVDSEEFAQEVQTALFEHWNQDEDQSNWRDQAMQNLIDIEAGDVPLGELRMVPLSYSNFITPSSGAWQSWASSATLGWLLSSYF